MIAVNGESSGYYALKKMHKKMLEDYEGQRILLYAVSSFHFLVLSLQSVLYSLSLGKGLELIQLQ